jgi:PAS domain S-box-containing protein
MTQPDFAALFQASPYPYLLLTVDFNITAANPSYLSAVGRTAQELVGRNLFDVFPPNPADPESTNDRAARLAIAAAIETKEPQTTPFLRYAVPRNIDGDTVFEQRYWSTINTPVLDAAGEVLFVAHSAIDVTKLYDFDQPADAEVVNDAPLSQGSAVQQAQAHQALVRILKSERNHLLGLFNQAPGFIAVLRGPQHVFETVNEAYYRLVGQRPLIGKPVREALPDVMGQGFEQILDRVFATGVPFVGKGMRVAAQREAGSPPVELYIDLLYQPVFEADGSVSGIFAQGQDVTEIYQANRLLREADRRKDEFLAMLAHELRNPLAPIMAAAELMPVIAHNPAKVDAMGRSIGRHVTHMSALLDDLLDVTRVTSGIVELTHQRISLQDAVAEAAEQLNSAYSSRSQHLTFDFPSEAVSVEGDHKRLVQVIANLLSNATKYSDVGASVAVRVAREGGDALLTVSDSGVGIDAEFIPYVFDLFSQSKRSSARSEGGLGIGLCLVKRLVELHGGSVRADSGGPGSGSCFTIRLPASQNSGADVHIPDQPGSQGLPAEEEITGVRVLVVDDNVEAATLMAEYLGLFGADVTVRHDAASALAAASSADYRLFLLDIGLPGGMDGYDLAKSLRASPRSASSTLIAISGYGQAEDRERGMEAGFDQYLVKPVKMERVLNIYNEAAKPRDLAA